MSSRRRSSSASRLPRNGRLADGEGFAESKSINPRKRLINVGNIQIDEYDLKRRMHRNMMHQLKYNVSAGPGSRQVLASSTKNIARSSLGASGFATAASGHNSSLNYIMRRKEQTKQIEENIQMLKRIHFARPTINY